MSVTFHLVSYFTWDKGDNSVKSWCKSRWWQIQILVSSLCGMEANATCAGSGSHSFRCKQAKATMSTGLKHYNHQQMSLKWSQLSSIEIHGYSKAPGTNHFISIRHYLIQQMSLHGVKKGPSFFYSKTHLQWSARSEQFWFLINLICHIR